MKNTGSLLLRLSCGLLAASPTYSVSAQSSITPSERRLIRSACDHNVVMLGENSHGDGATIALKAKLVPELVRRCGFSAIAFESSFYDFAELAHVTKADQRYDRSKLLSAVGLLWARDAEFRPLTDWLSSQTPQTVRLDGLDDQIGAAGAFYSLKQMPLELSAVIPARDQSACRESMTGYINFSIDRASAAPEVDRCLSLALHKLSTITGAQAAKLRAMAQAFSNVIHRARLTGNDMIAARDQAMADELRAFRRMLKKGSKIIVWTANAHAAYGGLESGKTLAQITRERVGPKLFTIGFSAATGQYRWSKSEVRDVPSAGANSLEGMVLNDHYAAVATRAQLQRLGTISGTALSWHKPLAVNWSKLFDVIYVIDRERPTTLVESQ